MRRPTWLTPNLVIICFTAFMVMGVLYAPQPLFQPIREEFGVDKATVGLTVTFVMLPLAVAPLGYGFLLASLPAKLILLAGLGLLSGLQLWASLTTSLPVLLAVRLGQGLLVPAVFTSLMTYLGRATSGRRTQRVMSVYIAATILGGFFCRFIPGLISTLTNWRYGMLAVFAGLCACFLLLFRLKPAPLSVAEKPRLSQLPEVLREPGFASMYAIIFLAFFVFSSIMNFLPFRLEELSKGISEFGVGAMYSAHIISLAVSLGAMRIKSMLGGEMRAVAASLAVYLVSCGIFLPASVAATWVAVFTMCGGMFLAHAVLPGYLNRLARGNTGLVNGIYISSYYLGGALGTYFPGFIYRSAGWNVYVACLAGLLVLALALSARMLKSGPEVGD
jgi:YNFM family putative membrane transporter